MPLFMLISGYLFYGTCRKYSLDELLRYKTRTLFMPLVMCSILNYYLTTGLIAVIRGEYSELINGSWLTNITSLWFLWSVLAFSIFLGITEKSVNNKYLKCILLIVGWMLTTLFPGADGNVFLYPYYIIGYYYAKNEKKIHLNKRVNCVIWIFSLVVFVYLIMRYQKCHYINTTGIVGHGYSFTEHMEINLLRWTIGLAGSVAILILIGIIYYRFHNSSIFQVLMCGVECLGKYSLEVYALSVSLLSSYLPFISKHIMVSLNISLFSHIYVFDWIITPMIAVIYSGGLLLLTTFLYKFGIGKFIFGERMKQNIVKGE